MIIWLAYDWILFILWKAKFHKWSQLIDVNFMTLGFQLTYFGPKTSRVQRRAPTDLLWSKMLSVQRRVPTDLFWSKNVTCPKQGLNWPTLVQNITCPTQGPNWPILVQKRYVSNAGFQLTYCGPKASRVQRRAPTDLLQSKTLSVQHRAPSDLLWSKSVTCPTQGHNWPTSVHNVKCPMQRPNWPTLFQKRYVSNAGPNWPFRGSDGWFPIIKGHNTNWLMHWRKRISRQSQIFKNAIFFKSQNISGQNSSYVQCM